MLADINCFLNVSFDLFIADVTSDGPSVNHVREFVASSFFCSKSFLQEFSDFSLRFDVCWIVTGREKVSRWFDLFSQFVLISTEHLFDTQRWMHTSNCSNVRELSSHFEGIPDSPAETNNKEAFVSLLFKVIDNTSESGFNGLVILVLDACDNFTHVHLSVVWFSQEFR